MNTIKKLTFAALAVIMLLFQTSPALADNSAPVRLTFEKSFAGGGPAPYLFHFDGSFGGDITGTLFVGVLVGETIDKKGQIFHVVADFEFTDDDGNQITARVEGNQNGHTGEALLNGVVTDGSLKGAQVQVDFVGLGGGNFKGTVRIMPASAK